MDGKNSTQFTNAHSSSSHNNTNVISNHVDDELDSENDAESIEMGLKLDYYIKNEIENNYPVKYIVIDSILMIALSLSQIVLQVILINNDAALAYTLSGIWGGIFNSLTVVMATLTIKYRNQLLIKVVSALKLFGLIISFGCFVILQIAALYNYDCIVASYYNPCYNKNMQKYHYLMIILGVPSLILSLVYFIFFHFKLMILKRNYNYQNAVKYANN